MKGNRTTLAGRAEKHAQRRAWLEAMPDLLAQLPGAHDDVTEPHSAALDVALRHMKHLQLYSSQSSSHSVRHGIRQLVSEIRGERGSRTAAKGQR